MRTEPGSKAPAIDVVELRRAFGEFLAVDGVSLRIAPGEVFGFIGPNGSGKSTTIRMLCGLLAPSGGRGRVAGLDILTEAEGIKSRIGYMSQRFSLYEELTVEENIGYYFGIYGIEGSRARSRREWAMSMPGLADRRTARVSSLPAGWKQQLAFCCALFHEPQIVFLDEPTSGVDPLTRRTFWEMIHEIADGGATVFVSTHFLDEAEYCDRIGLIHRGRLIAADSPGRLKTSSAAAHVLELRCAEPWRALQLLKGLPAVREGALFGNAIHLLTREPDAATREIRATMAGAGVEIDGLGPIAASLEDVFVALVDAPAYPKEVYEKTMVSALGDPGFQ